VAFVKVVYSRHARRRAKLYGIPESVSSDLLTAMRLHQGENVLVREVRGISYPLKIVVSIEGDTITVITIYPLKKGRKK